MLLVATQENTANIAKLVEVTNLDDAAIHWLILIAEIYDRCLSNIEGA